MGQKVTHTPAKALIETIEDAGYSVMTGADSDGNSVAEATSEQNGETFVVRADDLYTAIAKLARQVGARASDTLT